MTTPVTHKVVTGDTLFSLAKKYGLTVNELKTINDLQTDRIKVGQILKLTRFMHTVVVGDTLFSLANKYATTVTILKSINGLKSDVIKLGQTLRLPERFGTYLIFQDEQGNMLSNLDYEIKLSDDTIQIGRADNMGCSECILSNKQLDIIDISIFVDVVENCCSAHLMLAANNYGKTATDAIGEYSLTDKVKNTASDAAKRAVKKLKFSIFYAAENKKISLQKDLVKQIKVKFTLKKVLRTRNLTIGERALVENVFGKETIKLDAVKIHEGEFVAYIQGLLENAITPNGEIFYPKGMFYEDFSDLNKVSKSSMRLFIHEMVHVWQYQLGYDVLGNGAKIVAEGTFKGIDPYNYQTVIKKRNHISEFNMEQQASIIAHHYMYIHHQYDPSMNIAPLKQDMDRILKTFNGNQKSMTLKPKWSNLSQTVLGEEVETYEADGRFTQG